MAMGKDSLRVSAPVVRAESVLDSIGTGAPRDFLSAGTRGSEMTRDSAGTRGRSSTTAAGGVVLGVGAAATDATGWVLGADPSWAGIPIHAFWRGSDRRRVDRRLQC